MSGQGSRGNGITVPGWSEKSTAIGTMRQGQNSKRSRGRGSGRRNVPPRHQTFDSNGPSVRIRGNAYQVHEKYLALARDAGSAGDRIAAENYLQHAEHYFRIINMENDGDSQGRGRSHPNGVDGRFERGFDGPDAQEPMIEMRSEAPRVAPAQAEPETPPANGASGDTDTAAAVPAAGQAAQSEPKRKVGRGNSKGRRTRAAPRASASGGDDSTKGTNGADSDSSLTEE